MVVLLYKYFRLSLIILFKKNVGKAYSINVHSCDLDYITKDIASNK